MEIFEDVNGKELTLIDASDDTQVPPQGALAATDQVLLLNRKKAAISVLAAAVRQLGNIELGATADQTGAEIRDLLDATLGSTDWRTGGGGGGVARTDLSLTETENSNNLALTGAYFGDTAPVLSSSAQGVFDLTNAGNLDWLNLDGNDANLDGSGNFVITLRGTNRRRTWDIFAANTNQDQDEQNLALSYSAQRSGADLVVTIGGLGGFGTNGFTIVLD